MNRLVVANDQEKKLSSWETNPTPFSAGLHLDSRSSNPWGSLRRSRANGTPNYVLNHEYSVDAYTRSAEGIIKDVLMGGVVNIHRNQGEPEGRP